MQEERIFTEILERMQGITNSEDLVSAVLQKLLFCPFCDGYSINQNDLKTHIRDKHTDKLESNIQKRVVLHDVDEEAKKINICPYCHYAVGNNWHSSPTTRIYSHIKEHEPPKISFSVSYDKELIQTYVKGTVEIKLFLCNFCRESFGASETLLKHLICKHSDSDPEKISDETKNYIKNCVSIFLEKNKDEKPRIESPENVGTREPIGGVNTIEAISLEEFEESQRGSNKRQKLISPPPKPNPKLTVIFPGRKFSKTAQSNEIDKGVISFPPRLKAVFSFAEQIKVRFRPNHEGILPYDKSEGYLSGLKGWYSINAVEPGDKILFRLLNQNPANIQIWTEWEKHLNYIIKCPSEGFRWQYLPIRDCLLHVFTELMRPAHYRELYAHISRHRDLAISSVIGTLSKYRGILFEHTGEGKWKRLQEPTIDNINGLSKNQDGQQPPVPKDSEKENKIWSIVKEIEEKDLVYKLLDRIREDLSFNQICQKIADEYHIVWNEIRDTGFINVNDSRLKRLSNGNFALTKWCDESKEQGPPTAKDETTQKAKLSAPETEKASPGFFKLFWDFCRRISGLLIKRRNKE